MKQSELPLKIGMQIKILMCKRKSISKTWPSQETVGTWIYVHEIQITGWFEDDIKINIFKSLKDINVEILVKKKLIYETNSDWYVFL